MTTTTATTTAASVYQQLRGHLTDLKLADAAVRTMHNVTVQHNSGSKAPAGEE